MGSIISWLRRHINFKWLVVGSLIGTVCGGIIGSVALGLLLGIIFSEAFDQEKRP